MDPVLILIGLCAASSVALGVVYGFQRSTAERSAIDARLGASGPRVALSPRSALRAARRSRIPFADLLPLSAESRAKMQLELRRAGDPLSVNEYLAIRTTIGLALALVILAVLAGLSADGIWLATLPFAGIVVGWLIPGEIIKRMANRRDGKIAAQLPEALTSIAKSLRAGTGILQGLAFAAGETPEPLGGELKVTLRDLQLGADPELTFAALAERVGNKDLDIAVTAILIQRNVGGNLSEILANVTRTIRERVKLQSEIKVLTARQKLQGNLVAALPIAVALMFVSVNPDTGKLLFTEPAGRIALAIGIGFEILGLWLIRRLGKVDY
jgi:tight adherence protein B